MSKINSIALLLLLSSCITVKGGSLNCGNKDIVACKMEFVSQINKEFQIYFFDIMKTEMMDIIAVFQAVLPELKATDPYAKMLQTSITALNNDIDQLKDSFDNYDKIRNISRNLEYHMQPHIMQVDPDDKSLAEFEKLLDKHNYRQAIEKFDVDEFSMTLCKAWSDLFIGLRQIDLKAFAAYNDINETVKSLLHVEDKKYQQELLREVTIKIRNFLKIPFLEEVIFYKDKAVKKE